MRGRLGVLMGIRRGQLVPLIGTLLLAGLAAVAPANRPQPVSAEGFGRWETALRHCRMSSQGQSERPCRRLRLEQNLEGLLSIRFVGQGQGGLLASEELTFAGVLAEGYRPMACRPDGRCLEPRQPVQLLVGSVARASFNSRGLINALPQARLARGQCRLALREIRCEAREDTREDSGVGTAAWRAEARIGP